MSGWRIPESSKYLKTRSRLLEDYYQNCLKIDSVNVKNLFYSASNVKYFIQNHPWKNKRLLTTHFTAIINFTYNSSDDLTAPQININLKDRLEFSNILLKKSDYNKKSSGANILKLVHLQKLIEIHNHSKDINSCFMIVQTLTSIRFDNLKDINNSNCTLTNLQCLCSEESVCNPISETCFQKLKFSNSKTGPFEVIIIPQALGCFRRIQSLPKFNLYNGLYNKWIKEKINDEYSSHSCRKFLCNLSYVHRNVASWKSLNTLKNYYMGNITQFCDLYYLIKSLDSISH